jgi:hypothetical protein
MSNRTYEIGCLATSNNQQNQNMDLSVVTGHLRGTIRTMAWMSFFREPVEGGNVIDDTLFLL